MILYRPIGTKELERITASGYTAFPPHILGRPIFYPVPTSNTPSKLPGSGTPTPHLTPESHTVGGRTHQEFWVPAEELGQFNQHIIGKIEITASCYGKKYEGDHEA